MKSIRYEIASLKKKIGTLKKALSDHDELFMKLDEAMASPEQIAEDTKLVGGFVSSLYMFETEEQIVNRAITHIQRHRKQMETIDEARK